MCSGAVRLFVAEERLMIGELENLRDRYLRLIPLENQHAMLFQDTETLTEHGLDICLPCLSVEAPVFLRHVACLSRITQVRWIEHDHTERLVRERQIAVVHQHVRLDLESASVTQFPTFVAHVTEEHTAV